MNRYTKQCLKWFFAILLFVSQIESFAETIEANEPKLKKSFQTSTPKKTFLAVGPEGKTLPENVARIRTVHKSVTGTTGLDSNGSPMDMGFAVKVDVNALVAEYGITDKLSFQLLVPYFTRQERSLDQAKFRSSAYYQKLYREKIEAAAKKLPSTGACRDLNTCIEFIERNESLAFSTDIFLETGEHFTLQAGQSIKNAIEMGILRAATPVKKGTTGLGDIESGLLYNIYKSEHLLFSTGLGLRLPTGSYDVPDGLRANSGGVFDSGLRINFDYSPVQGLWFSFQEQVEYALSQAYQKRTSLLDNRQFNQADPYQGGDGKPNIKTIKKIGLNYDSLAKVSWGLGSLHPLLQAFGVNANYRYKKDRTEYTNDIQSKQSSDLHTTGMGLVVSGLAYRIPLEFEFNYSTPVFGKNAPIAPSSTETTLKAYMRF